MQLFLEKTLYSTDTKSEVSNNYDKTVEHLIAQM